MANKVMGILANILMVVEACALVFLVTEWIKAKRGNKDGCA